MRQQMQVNVPLGNLPVHLVCIIADGVGYVAFQKHIDEFKAIICPPKIAGGIEAIFTPDSFEVNGVGYVYNTGYKLEEHPNIKTWLIMQRLDNPLEKQGETNE